MNGLIRQLDLLYPQSDSYKANSGDLEKFTIKTHRLIAMKPIKSIMILGTLSLTAGCAGMNPYIQDFNIISLDQERVISDKLADEVRITMTLVDDPRQVLPITMLGDRLVTVLPQRDFEYQFFLVEDRTPNAFTIPGGKIYIHTGLLEFVHDGDELAGVIAHEIGHAYERHPTKNLSRAYGMQFLANLLLQNNQSNVKNVLVSLSGQGILSKYTRDDEREADDIGYLLLNRAGFRTDGLLRFLEQLQQIDRGGHPIPFLSTHPPTAERIERLQSELRS